MSFREKSAWVMAGLMVATGLYYLWLVRTASEALGSTAPAFVAAPYVGLVILGSIILQVALAVFSPRQAGAPADERERLVNHRAGNWSGWVLASGVVVSLGYYLVRADGNLLFHTLAGALILSQIAEYGFQIVLLRRT